MNPDSLIHLCLLEITKMIPYLREELQTLPRSVKTELLRLACRRDGVLENVDILRSLVHPDIEAINFVNCETSDEMLAALSVCHSLRVLKIRGSADISNTAFVQLFPHLPNLETLHVIKCSTIDDDTLKLIVESCPLLTILNISNSDITSMGLEYISKLKLKSLNIKGFYISDEGINRFLSGVCKDHIEEFLFTDCSYESYENIIKKCANLNTIIGTKIFDHHALAGNSEFMRPMKHISFIV